MRHLVEPGGAQLRLRQRDAFERTHSRNVASPDVLTHAQARQGQHETHRHRHCAKGDSLLHSSGVPDPNGANESGTVVGGNVRTSRPFE
jgi:hypothetical protein